MIKCKAYGIDGYWAVLRHGKLWCMCVDKMDATLVSHMELTKINHEQKGKRIGSRIRFIAVAQ